MNVMGRMHYIKEWIVLLRVKHYIKNFLIFLPLLFSKQFFDNDERLLHVAVAFLAFSFVASAIYLFNDIQDCEKDRSHPTKKERPIASGKISLPAAWGALGIILVSGMALGTWVSSVTSWAALIILLLYVLLNVLYSIKLKHIPVLEIGILASGFMMRVMLGGYVSQIRVSDWLYLTILAAAFYMGLGKRRNELQKCGDKETRKVLRRYNTRFLDRNMYMFLALAIAFYSLWSMSQGTGMIWTVPIVMLLAMRYSLIVEGASDGDPVELILKDKALLLLSVVYASLMMCLLYL